MTDYRDRIGPGSDHRQAVVERNASDRNQRLLSQGTSCPYTFQPDYWIGVFFGEGRKDGADGQIIGRALTGSPELLWIVGGDSEKVVDPDDSPRSFRRKIILPEVDSMGPCGDSQVSTVVDNQQDFIWQDAPQLAGHPDNLPRRGPFLSQLDERCAAIYDLTCELDYFR